MPTSTGSSEGPGEPAREPPLYRPFGQLAFGATLLVGTPIGLWLLAWLYWGLDAVAVPWRLLHAHTQTVGFFGVLIPGMAQHVLARFAGRPARRHRAMTWVLALLAGGLALRVADVVAARPVAALVAALVQAAAFAVLAGWVWWMLGAAPLAPVRRRLAASTSWLAAGMLLEAWLRWRALTAGALAPDLGGMRAVHALVLYGGVLGWVLGVLLRAGPMFVTGWRVPAGAAAAAWLLGLAAAVAAAGELMAVPSLARLGELGAVGTVLAALWLGGAFTRHRAALPMLARGGIETRIFRLAMGSTVAAAIGLAAAAGLAAMGRPDHLVTDAARHLVTVGLLTSVVVAMTFRLLPAIESRPLPWPALRAGAFWALLLAVALRTSPPLVGLGWAGLAPVVPLSGPLAWVAVLCVGINLFGIARRPRRLPAGPSAS